MSYIIDIIDTQNDNLVLSLEKAERDSVILDSKGSDNKDEPFLIGKTLKFTMVGMSCEDLQYGELFTGDETRFKVRVYDEEDTTIWTGFILPDQYSEPYNDSPILIDFVASDGLGRLKSKYLPEDFYDEEKSIIEIISKCLELTGLTLDYRFAPAIENTQQKDYNKIYLPTSDFLEKERRKDAHTILESLMKDMVSIIYQEENVWNIEGLNIRNQRVYTTKIYNYLGEYQQTVEITRLQKNITGIATPIITMQPPYGIIEVKHERVNLDLPKTLTTETNDGWVTIDTGMGEGRIFVTEWFGHEDYYAFADSEDLNVYLPPRNTETGYNNHVSLRTRPYLKKGYKYEIKLNFEIEKLIKGASEEQVKAYIDAGAWTDPFIFHITQNTLNWRGEQAEKYLFANWLYHESIRLVPQEFNNQGISENTLQFIAEDSGLLDINIFALIPYDGSAWGINNDLVGRGILSIILNRVEIKELGFEDEYIAVRTTDDEYTIKKEITLNYADDSTAFAKSFRLQKLNVPNTYNEIPVNFRRQFQRDGFWYASFLLQGANLIKDNIEFVYQDGVLIEVLDVIYNYKDSEEYVIKLNAPLADNSSTDPNEGRHSTDVLHPYVDVRVYDYNSVLENREYWEQWTDSIYKVEKLRYPEAVANIYERMFDIPIPKIDFTLKNNVKLNDIIKFNFVKDRNWIITNCRWNIDKGTTTVTAIESYYAIEGGQNIPPVVEAGNDIIIIEEEEANLTSDAFDPDGFIVSYLWEEITNNGAILQNPNDQNITATNLTGDFYTFRVTVTDNDGATATDTVNVFRREEITLTLVETSHTVTDNSTTLGYISSEKMFDLVLTPDISEGVSINFRGPIKITHQGFNLGRVIFYNNGGIVSSTVSNGGDPSELNIYQTEFSINYFSGDNVQIKLFCRQNSSTGGQIKTEATFNVANFTDGNGEVLGMPITIMNEI